MNTSRENTTGELSPVARAEALITELRTPRPRAERSAWAIHHEQQAAATLEELIAYLRGFEQGSAAEQKRLLGLVSSLLSAIAPLFERGSVTPFGRPSDFQNWLEGTAPRLRRAYITASEFLKGSDLQ